jgi:hypothetical protein
MHLALQAVSNLYENFLTIITKQTVCLSWNTGGNSTNQYIHVIMEPKDVYERQPPIPLHSIFR